MILSYWVFQFFRRTTLSLYQLCLSIDCILAAELFVLAMCLYVRQQKPLLAHTKGVE